MTNPVRLVVADDTELIRRAVQHVVTDCCPGVEVVGEAKDFEELFRVTKDTNPQVILMDLNMPGEIESDQIRIELDSCCLLIMSAWFDDRAKAKARDCGASEMLDKSTLAGTLRPAIERCLNKSKAAAK